MSHPNPSNEAPQRKGAAFVSRHCARHEQCEGQSGNFDTEDEPEYRHGRRVIACCPLRETTAAAGQDRAQQPLQPLAGLLPVSTGNEEPPKFEGPSAFAIGALPRRSDTPICSVL